jgi:glycosyltransferase involved in cell wall biosynthesis
MPTCVFLSHSAVSSGAELGLVTGLSLWAVSGRRAILLLAEDGPVVERARDLGVEVLVNPIDRSAQSLRREHPRPWHILRTLVTLVRFSSQVRRVLEANQADVVVANSVKSLVYGLLAGRRARAKVVWSIHDRISPDYLPPFVVPLLRHLVPRLVHGIVVNSEATLETIRPGRTPVLVSYPPIALDERHFAGPGDPVRSVVCVGRLAPWKAQDNFLRAFAQVFGGTDTRATVVGGALFGEVAYGRSLVDLAEALGIAHQVEFTGHVADVWTFLVDADILVHCSRIPEPFGQVVVQGMWGRCAVVASTPGGPAEVITDRVDGLLTPAGDVPALIGALTELRDDAGLRDRLAQRSRSSARQYDVHRTAPHLRQWLTSLAADDCVPGSVTRPGKSVPLVEPPEGRSDTC